MTYWDPSVISNVFLSIVAMSMIIDTITVIVSTIKATHTKGV